MFNFFKRIPKADVKEEETIQKKASIEFYVENENDTRPKVTINIDDYDDASINALCNIVNVLAEDSLVVETYNIIQNFLLQENRHDVLMKVLLLISQTKTINSKFHKSAQNNEPYIKPSELH